MKKIKNNIDGVILLDKATGITSNRALQQVKHLLQANKAGHTGSLDPLASGVLPICLGQASKFARFLLDADKTYIVSAMLGVVTDSGDCTGNVMHEKPVPAFAREEIINAINTFVGDTKQIPSMFSALKHQGQPLYKFARQNIEVARSARDITVYSYELLDFKDKIITAKIKCSKGTYVRTLIEDLGALLGCGAHVTSLRRVTAGAFSIEQTKTFDILQEANLLDVLLPPTVLLQGLNQITLSNHDAQAMLHGKKVFTETNLRGMVCLLTTENSLLGIAEAKNDGQLVAVRLMAPDSTVCAM